MSQVELKVETKEERVDNLKRKLKEILDKVENEILEQDKFNKDIKMSIFRNELPKFLEKRKNINNKMDEIRKNIEEKHKEFALMIKNSEQTLYNLQNIKTGLEESFEKICTCTDLEGNNITDFLCPYCCKRLRHNFPI